LGISKKGRKSSLKGEEIQGKNGKTRGKVSILQKRFKSIRADGCLERGKDLKGDPIKKKNNPKKRLCHG